ncbi:MAG TPA: right-handed parallel beta-helix repeat-containing protein [Acidimicrobiales bacterium]|nr:right-handed parallel beta-helix repeat-containing protein [Acidimicrobiales bacterium]
MLSSRRSPFIYALVPALLLLFVPAAASAATTLVVDDDMVCEGAAFSTIQSAVDAASPGDTVKVCAGGYTETVTVDKTLVLQGAKANVDARTRVQTGESVVKGPGGGFRVQADNVAVNGFTVKDATGGPGIELSRTNTGATVSYNIIKNSVFGIYANSSGAGLTTISYNRIFGNNGAGSAGGNGIYSDQGLVGGRINHNLLEGHQNAGVLVALTSFTVNDLAIKMNSSLNNASFVAIFHGTNVKVAGNTSDDTIVEDNNAQGSSVFVGGNSSTVVVKANIIKHAAFDGVAVRAQANGVSVQGNTVKASNRDGISVTASTPGGVTVASNTVKKSQRDGITFSAETSGDTITGNTSLNNDIGLTGAVDCADASLGEGTAGTANTWTANTGVTSSPPGLCTPPA